MLKVMRDSFHHLKWVLIAVVAAFVFGFVFIDMGLGGATGGQSDEIGYAARVNGEMISFRDYNRALYFAEENYKRMYGNQLTPEMMEAMGLQRQVLDSLVDERLLLQEARRLDLVATPEEIRRRIREIPTLNPDGKFVGTELYTRYVTGQLGFQNAAEFEEELARSITIAKMESALQNSVVVSQKTADTEYRRMNETARIRYVSIPAARELASVTVTPAEVDAFYKANQARYSHGEQRNVKYLLADFARLRAQVTPSEEELRKRYEAQKEEFKSPDAAHVFHILVKVDPSAAPTVDAAARAEAEAIVKQLRGGADFATLAKQNSDDPSSSGAGGDMGFVDRGMTVAAFEEAIFSIPVNTISDPIRTPEYGYHIVKVTERRPGSIKSFEEVRAQLAGQVTEKSSRELAQTEMNRIAAQLKAKKPANADQFAALASANVSSNETQWFQKGDSIPGLGYNPPLGTWVFSAKQGDVGEIIGTQRGMIIPYLAGVRGAGVTPLAEIRQRVETDAKTAKANEVVKSALAAVAGAPTIDAVAAKTGANAAETTVSRQGFTGGFQGDTTDLVNAAMSGKVGEVKGPVVVGDVAVAFQVLEQKRVEEKDLVSNRDSYMQALRQQQSRSLRKVLIDRLRRDSKVEINETAVRSGGQAGA